MPSSVCPQCGDSLPAWAAFCGNCGARLQPAEKQVSAQPAPLSPEQTTPAGQLSATPPSGQPGFPQAAPPAGPAPMFSLPPQPVMLAPPNAQAAPGQGISRRKVLIGLGVAGVVVTGGGGAIWYMLHQRSAPGGSNPVGPTFPITGTIGTVILKYQGHTATVWQAVWSHDGRSIASASEDKTVQVWDAVTGKQITVYRKHTEDVGAVAWSPDDKRIVSGSSDKTAQVWEVATGKTLVTYRGHPDGVYSVAWSPDGKRIAFVSNRDGGHDVYVMEVK